MILSEDERLDDLQLDGLKIIQNKKAYGFTSDSVLLANFISAKDKDELLEIGAGSGIISMLVNYKNKPKHITAFEIQEKAASLCQRNIDLNHMENKITVINDKIQNFKKYLDYESMDIVFCNPPYFNQSVMNISEEIAISRHEKYLSLQELCAVSGKILKFNGKFYVVYPSNRCAELIYELKINKLEPKIMFFAQPGKDKEATVVLVQAVKGGKQGVKVLPALILNADNGEYLETIQKLYKK